MDLIIKPTELCNFKCTFCSSTNITEDKALTLDLDHIFNFIDKTPNLNTIIVNGGDPLMLDPDYYWKIIEHLDKRGSDSTISFTTNLWAFYKKPEKWLDLFKHPRMGVSTSFQFGGGRLKGDGKELTVEEFWSISDMMLEMVGYRPSFISVISNENIDRAIDCVLLAKEMDVECKLNHLMASGDEVVKKGIKMGASNEQLILGDIYEIYVKIHEMGLAQWEYNTKQMSVVLKGQATSCPLKRDCSKSIRAIQPSGDMYTCGSFGDDRKYPTDSITSDPVTFVDPLATYELLSMKSSCFECPMFLICNGCKKTISDTKRLGNVEQNCKKMKGLAQKIIDINGMTDQLRPTDYVAEYIDIVES